MKWGMHLIADDECQNCVHARPIQKLKYQHACQHYNGPNCNLTYFCREGKEGSINAHKYKNIK